MDTSAKVVFISGANRGIGYQLAMQFAAKSYQVIAGYRDKSRAVSLLKQAENTANLHPFQVDVASKEAIEALGSFIRSKFNRLDILINNAGINQSRTRNLEGLEWSDIAHHLDINVGGAFLASQQLYPLIKKGADKKIINISSQLGSIGMGGGGPIPYSISKAALNMLTKNLSTAFRADGITVISMHPGWVRTDMGGHAAPLSAEDASAHIVTTIEGIAASETGDFLNYDGTALPY